MKKLFCTILSLFLLAGCGESSPAATSTASPANVQKQPASAVDVDKNGKETVDITLSADFINFMVKMTQMGDESATAESFYETIKESSPNAVLNDDGSITVQMSKADYEKTLNTYEENIDQAISKMLKNANGYLSITDISHNKDLSHFDITISGDEPNLYDSFYAVAFYMYGGLYNAFKGNKNPVITIDYHNPSGVIVASASSEDLKK